MSREQPPSRPDVASERSHDAVDSVSGAAADKSVTNRAPTADESDDEPPGNRGADLERRIADLEADLDAVYGLLDGVEAVDEEVERRAATALAKVETLEARLDDREPGLVRERLPDDRSSGPDAAGDDGRDPGGGSVGDAAADDCGDGRAESPAHVRGGLDDLSRGRQDDDAAGRHSRVPAADRTGDDDTDGRSGDATISSVGGSRDDTSGSDASLAARLRDAFR